MKNRSALLTFFGLLLAAAAAFFPVDAFAQQQQWAQACSNDGSLYGIFCSISTEMRYIPKTLTVIAYASAVVLTMFGLLNLKAHGDDPSSVPLRSIIMKFVLAGMLIALPLAMQVVVATIIGKANIEQNTKLTARPCVAHSSLMELRGGQSPCR